MGAVLVCFGDHEPDFGDIRQRRERSSSEDSLLDRLQKNWSCGSLGDDQDEDEDPINWDAFLLQSNKSTASSGSRMLSAFYSRLLEENDDCAFYFDIRGKRIKGAYLDRVELLDDYFLPLVRRRAISTEKSPPLESLEMYSSSEDCFSTSSTMISELDYWASSDPLFTSEDRRYDPRYLPSKPTLGRCASWGAPAHTELKIHRTFSSPYKQEDSCFTRFQSSSAKPFLSSAMGLAA
ncbi:hypothetical protein F441_17656 [Phytophthora nicotianae CJ01A1]|uniref:Uncharacterized protein n=5 Tax=Phytophthora nicotianae TaxID=4792 RepID=V9ECN0_PHYNI|nr:hypothetical protein F443_17778 [Phytophthora nicotianae P1569]ETK76252.1 hypothetical protein L915_17309 [Phytophthora nicotianae]ETO64760.1 hypothetical protein F444_17816 [Phytophthora nicotianae P1976]ETP05846.1 hypothetical protein F441_17656 [Phytophthora nicotianae CJ01A1]ETL29693.1 hypothetical protein L916_17202 [Phytophthora nicotianae]